MASLRKRGKVWYYRFVGVSGVQVERRGATDRRVTEGLAAAAEAEAARIRAGLSDPKAEARARHAARSLVDHLADWQSHLAARGATAKHIRLFSDRARRVIALARGARLSAIDPPKGAAPVERERAAATVQKLVEAARLADLDRDSVQAALATLKASGRSLATCNHHRNAIRAFTRWAWKGGRTIDDALVGVEGFNAREDRRHDRRTIGVEELRRLIEAAHRGAARGGLSGPDRALCYRLAVATGLRYSEIKSVTPGSFALAGDHPTVTVAAGYTKNGEPATLPLPPDLAADLRPWLADKPSGLATFPLPARGADMLKVDLEAAGIPYRDGAGLVFDFHALRCECATLADAAGNTPRVVQKLMRHSTLELTGRYTRPRPVDLERAAGTLPSLRPTPPTAEPMAATGTDGANHQGTLALHLPYTGDGMGRDVADAGAMTMTRAQTPSERKPLAETAIGGESRTLAVPAVRDGLEPWDLSTRPDVPLSDPLEPRTVSYRQAPGDTHQTGTPGATPSGAGDGGGPSTPWGGRTGCPGTHPGGHCRGECRHRMHQQTPRINLTKLTK